ncbi:hypothetical protein YC2023_118623 [Brassica napus]|uniref:(rape) hypothetical protein n=1 Tax=Brassica napus TaxID=3708 RepID=A0A816J8A3_BRANA|nr:unnamed protein product [Brassica napus]
MQRGDHNFKSTHKLKEFEPSWTDLEKESNNDEKEREREREDQYKKDTYGVLSGSKTFSHCFFFWFFFRTFYEALPWKCSNHPEKETLSLFDHLERESGFLSSTGSLPVQRSTTISAMQ